LEGLLERLDIACVRTVASPAAAGLSELWIESDRNDVSDAQRRQLLAVHRVRRRLERRARANESPVGAPMAVSRQLLHELQELVAALDSRAPQVLRAGEAAIARDADALRARALERIEELEREAAAPRGR
jgi:hypothetical protein